MYKRIGRYHGSPAEVRLGLFRGRDGVKAAATLDFMDEAAAPATAPTRSRRQLQLIQQRRNDVASTSDILPSAPDRHRRELQLPDPMIETSSRTGQLRLPRVELNLTCLHLLLARLGSTLPYESGMG